MTDTFRLTELTQCGGCAAKLGADLLAELLPAFSSQEMPEELIVGLGSPDDAAAYKVASDAAVLATVDFFPPIVDDPFTFGAIAAANAANDIFAMGGRVVFGLNLAALPEDLPREVAKAIFAGGMSKLQEAGGVVAGGHTLQDAEPKYGMAVIGLGDPDRLLRKGGAQPGDILILTKPLGTGLIVSAARQGRAEPAYLAAAVASMLELNQAASVVLMRHRVRAATDITGFGLLGHALEMAKAGGCRFIIESASLPAIDGSLQLVESGVRTDGSQHNRRFVQGDLSRFPDVASAREELAFDPQTSGGLLAAVPAEGADEVCAALRHSRVGAWRVGSVQSGTGVALI